MDVISTHTPAWGVTYRLEKLWPPPLISTHTPAWGVTLGIPYSTLQKWISTHTPAWGVTFSQSLTIGYISHFNSHARVGRDVDIVKQERQKFHFNSHARVGRDFLPNL